MKIRQLASEYLLFKRSLGVAFERAERHLSTFCDAMGDVEAKNVSPEAVRKFLDGNGPITRNWHHKYGVIKGLYRYAVNRGYVDSSPLPKELPKVSISFQAYPYSAEEFHRLLKAVDEFDRPQNRFTSLSYRTLLLLLFNTGLRIGEALSLTLGDIDLPNKIITVRDSKFYKSRLVPISSKLTKALGHYIEQERSDALRLNRNDLLFAQRNGRPYGQAGARNRFKRLCNRIGVHRRNGSRFHPRIHDIRHAFAINRLLTWYRQGANVQQLLPYLSTYLGHIEIKSTQRYLAILPELLSEANSRFEQYALSRGTHVRK